MRRERLTAVATGVAACRPLRRLDSSASVNRSSTSLSTGDDAPPAVVAVRLTVSGCRVRRCRCRAAGRTHLLMPRCPASFCNSAAV